MCFLQTNTDTAFHIKICDNEHFCSIYIGFNKSFLFEFHENYYNKKPGQKKKEFITDVIKMPCTPYMKSLYIDDTLLGTENQA